MTYKEQLADPRWQKKRLEVFERDNFTCQICSDTETTLHVHHKSYDKTYQTMAWAYPMYVYQTLCSDCHAEITAHIKEYGANSPFDVMKIKYPEGQKSIFVYSNGLLKLNLSKFNDGKEIIVSENSTHKIVQFLINNWLKNG